MASYSRSHDPEADVFLICPFDKNHKLANRKYTNHVISCPARKHRPDLTVCPYDQMHIIPVKDVQKHLLTCVMRHQSRQLLERDLKAKEEGQAKTSVQPQHVIQFESPTASTSRGNHDLDFRNFRLTPDENSQRGDYDDNVWGGNRSRSETERPERKTLVFNWRTSCFRENGSLIKPLDVMGMQRLSQAERVEYQGMLNKSCLMQQELEKNHRRNRLPTAEEVFPINEEQLEWCS